MAAWTSSIALRAGCCALLVAVAALSAGCASMEASTRQRQVASMLTFLFPGKEQPDPPSEKVTVLNVPFRIGVAFVPDSAPAEFRLSETDRLALAARAREARVSSFRLAVDQMVEQLHREVRDFRERAPSDPMIQLVLPPGYAPPDRPPPLAVPGRTPPPASAPAAGR